MPPLKGHKDGISRVRPSLEERPNARNVASVTVSWCYFDHIIILQRFNPYQKRLPANYIWDGCYFSKSWSAQVKGQCYRDMKTFGKICASTHLFIHKLLFRKIYARSKSEKSCLCFSEVQENKLKNVSLPIFSRCLTQFSQVREQFSVHLEFLSKVSNLYDHFYQFQHVIW